MSKLSRLMWLAWRLEKAGRPQPAALLRTASLHLGVELLPLFEDHAVAAEELHQLRAAAEEAGQLLAIASLTGEIDAATGERVIAQLRAALGVDRG